MCLIWFRHSTVQGGAIDASTFLLRQADPNGFSDSCNRRWCDRAPDGTRSTDSDCVLRGRLPSCSATERRVRT